MKTKIFLGGLLSMSLLVSSQSKFKKQLFKHELNKAQSISMPVSPLYAFSTFTAPYNSISGTTVTGGLKWDDLHFNIPIGFNFTLYTQSSSSITAAVGGMFFSFNDVDNDSYITLASPLFEDICDRAYMPSTDSEGDPGGVSSISYTTVGTPGNKICKIQMSNVGFYGENDVYSTSTSFLNYQIWLYEVGTIEFRYGNVNIQNPGDNLNNPVTGFVTGLLDSLDFTNTGNATWSNMIDGPFANPSIVQWNPLINMYVNGAVDMGRVYRFDRLPNNVGIKESTSSEILSVYPNTASTKIEVRGMSINSNTVRLSDVNGRMVYCRVNNNCVDVSELQNGIYFIYLEGKERVEIRKVIIAH